MVRCAGCGAAVSEWAARCPQCGADLDDATPILEPPGSSETRSPTGPDPDPSTPSRRSRRRVRRPLAAMAVLVVILGAGLGWSLAGGAPAHRSAPGAGPASLASLLGAQTLRSDVVAYTGSAGVEVAPVDGQRLTHVPGPPNVSGPPAGPAEQTSAGLVFVQGGTAYLLAAPFTDPPRALLPADGLFPMMWPGVVGAEREAGVGRTAVTFVDLQDGNASPSPWWVFPSGYRPVSQLLASGPGGVLRPWQLISGGVALGAPLG